MNIRRTILPGDHWLAWQHTEEGDVINLVALHPCVFQLWAQTAVARGITPDQLGPLRLRHNPGRPGYMTLAAATEAGILCLDIPPRCWCWEHELN